MASLITGAAEESVAAGRAVPKDDLLTCTLVGGRARTRLQAVGQGFARPSYETQPIDVPVNKLLEWLVDRKRTVPDWYKRAQAIQARTETLQRELRGHATLGRYSEEGQGPLTYDDCVTIVEALKASEGDVNMLNQYTSARLKQWIQVQRAYEKDGVFLGEGAHRLIQAVQFSIFASHGPHSPGQKRQIAAWQQQIKDLARRDTEHRASAAAYKSKFDSLCRDLGIPGDDVARELPQLVLALPTIFADLVAILRGPALTEAIDYYQSFVAFVRPSPDADAAALLPVIRFVCERGNVGAAAFAERFQLAPKARAPVDARPPVSAEPDAVATGSAEPTINWDVEATSEAPGVLGDVPAAAAATDEVVIDWDISDVVAVEAVPAPLRTPEAAETPGSAEWAIEVEEAGQVDGSTALDDERARALLLSDLLELQAFLSQRATELGGKSDMVALQLFQSAPASVSVQSEQSLRRLGAEVARALDLLQGPRVQRLYQLQTSRRYLDRLCENLLQQLRLSRAMQERLASNVGKRARLAEQIQEASAAIAQQSGEARAIKQRLEVALSKLYEPRSIHIISDL